MKRFAKFIDNLLLLIIFLSIVQLVVDDLGTIKQWGDSFTKWMIYVGFAFDVIFSIEFIVRSITALKRKNFIEYFMYCRGWIDFFASIPLLILSSGPSLIVSLSGQAAASGRSMFNIFKVIKAIRVTRVLRLLRTLKIFGKIENVFSRMGQHHISTVVSFIITSSVVIYMGLSTLGVLNIKPNVAQIFHIEENDLTEDQYEQLVLLHDARVSLVFTLVMIGNVLILTIFYSKHFAQNVGDPIYVIKRGMTEDNYNFTAKIKEPYKDEEVFELAEAYNSIWLPMKVRIQSIRNRRHQQSQQLPIDDDYSDLL